tara:strand:- start:292 stop:414 length:123 start_codon:yes stop_codon:yes gene_type:complete
MGLVVVMEDVMVCRDAEVVVKTNTQVNTKVALANVWIFKS